MRYSSYFPKTLRQPPSGEESANAKLLEQAGFIRKHMAGVYNYLPMGLITLRKIEQVIREEMNSIGAQELLMSSLQPKELWEKTGRWETLGADNMYQFSGDASAKTPDIGLGITHEEVITDIASKTINSYRDLPVYLYQIQTKFRNEKRARFGLVRGREFVMKDLYSFNLKEEEHHQFYESIKIAYLKAFQRVGLPVLIVEASGGVFSKEYSHEFQVLVDSGEDEIIHCGNCDFAQNREINQDKAGDKCPRCGKELKVSNGIEVGNIFHLGAKYSEALGLTVLNEKGEKTPVIMGSYGWGPSRIMGTIVEVSHDDKGIIWPESVAPFKVHLIGLDLDNPEIKSEAERVYANLQHEGVEVLFDDRVDISPGAKFSDADLIGTPYRVVVSKRTGDKLELKKRFEDHTSLIELDRLIELVR